ncbi:MAG: glycine betaine ABC transporter substrate-binding protein [Galbitalea sp.]
MTPAFAKANDLVSIGDLKKLSSFTLAANPEFQTRPDGIKGLQTIYGLNNIKFQAISDGGGPQTLAALLNNSVQVADIYSTTPSILANKLVTLTDPKSLFASQEVVPIVSTSKVNAKLTSVLNKVSAKLTTKDPAAAQHRGVGWTARPTRPSRRRTGSSRPRCSRPAEFQARKVLGAQSSRRAEQIVAREGADVVGRLPLFAAIRPRRDPACASPRRGRARVG